MSPSISPLNSPPLSSRTSSTTFPTENNDSTFTSTVVSTLDPEQLKQFYAKYPDYCEEEQAMPLWIEGVDTTYAPFIPTSTRRVLIALEMVGLNSSDKVLDVGSGDGRFCYAAVSFFGARKAIGIEYEQDLVEKSTELAQEH
ncbi:hypothetical protein BC939DRAFT_501927, partial [Gamsiella multidivaricata]|uniref:uncharacterized protein n=1 Tax=Gamsiella multidivaricata TaxID=101098 RepID=UPI0022208D18